MPKLLSFTNITCLVFLIYVSYTIKTFYEMFNPPECNRNVPTGCIFSIKNWQNDFTLALCIPQSQKSLSANSPVKCSQSFDLSEFYLNETSSKSFTVEIPSNTRKNGSLMAYVFLGPRKLLKSQSKNSLQFTASQNWMHQIFFKELLLSKHKQNKTNLYVNLLESSKREKNINEEDTTAQIENENRPITHLLTNINVYTMDTVLNFNRYEIPGEIYQDLRLTEKNNEYLPILHIDKLSIKDDEYKVLNESQTEYVLSFNHQPTSIGKIRLFKQLEASIESFRELGINDDQMKEVIALFTETNFYLIMLTFFVSVFHLLFEFLAFKNDINFWRKRKTTVGLSIKTIIWRALSQIIIFLYLMEEKTSLLILVPSGISVFIEIWKTFKAFKVKIEFSSLIPSIKFGESSTKEKETNQYDSIAMTKLSYVLYPLCIAGAIYSLIYNTHKNWYSWLLNSLVNGVYAFGFLFMTPQLFLNYKLKSVAHLPWKAFTYKAFNTFIDDIFAFIIKMPTSHRIACLRDDLVFLVYLYQKWLYPIDKTRVNEFGESFDDIDDSNTSKTKKE